MQQPQPLATAAAVLPRYADWLTVREVMAECGAGSVQVVMAWITVGIKSDGGRIYLRAVKVGKRWRIDPAAVVEFVARTTASALPPSATPPPAAAPNTPAPPKPDTAADLKRRGEACMARMRARGWLNPAAATDQQSQPRTPK